VIARNTRVSLMRGTMVAALTYPFTSPVKQYFVGPMLVPVMPWVVVRHAPTTASHVNPKKATTRRLLLNTALTRKKKRRLLEETAKGYVQFKAVSKRLQFPDG